MASWPTSLPAPLISTLKETPPNNTIRSSVDKGPAKVRRRTTANVRGLSFSMMLQAADVATLDSFFTNDTFGGSISFVYTHPRTGAQVDARFTQPPQYSENEGVCYSADIQLEILPTAIQTYRLSCFTEQIIFG